MKNNKKTKNNNQYIPLGMCLGISIGTIIGVSTNKLAICMPIGLSIGMCIGSIIDATKRNDEDGESKTNNKDTK